MHVGVCYTVEGESYFLHLAWHRDLRREPGARAAAKYAVGEMQLPDVRQYVAARYLEHVWSQCQAGVIPYGVGFREVRFDPAGALVLGPGATGLTCATFVARVLEGAGLPVVALETWAPGRPGDAEWREFVANALAKSGAPPEHVAAVRADTTATRLRPEEISYACIAEPSEWPMSLAVADRPAALLRAVLRANCRSL
jgi:hypothetical protein